MAGKGKKVEQPIDRPLSKAYLRGFKGMSTAYPPGASEPASLRVMENVVVDRNGSVRVRPGLRYASYISTPDMDPATPGVLGDALDVEVVGELELFYTNDGDAALLFAARELDGTVSFRALLSTGALTNVYALTDDLIGFNIPQGEAALRFTEATTYVKYLQLNNRILALSNAGEEARLFYVGAQKVAKRLNAITMPEWVDEHKPEVFHPDAAWINAKATTTETNGVHNPQFEGNSRRWNTDAATTLEPTAVGTIIRSLPERTNMVTSPLGDLTTYGIAGWASHPTWTAVLTDTDPLLKIAEGGLGRFFAQSAKTATNVKGGERYHFAVDLAATNSEPWALLTFYSMNGVPVDKPIRVPMNTDVARFVSPSIEAPQGAVTARLAFGGEAAVGSGGYIQIKDVVLCKADESTVFFDGSLGTYYFWEGVANESASVYHPPVDVTVTSDRFPLPKTTQAYGGIRAYPYLSADRNMSVDLLTYDRDNAATTQAQPSVLVNAVGWVTKNYHYNTGAAFTDKVTGALRIVIEDLPRGDGVQINDAMLVPGVATATYFDGNTPDTSTVRYSWVDPLQPYNSPSRKEYYAGALPALAAETPTANTLVKTGGSAANEYKMAVFYTFENEVGESAPSRMTEIRMQRPWSNWNWETANASGEPSGTATSVAELCADQLVVRLPQDVYDKAISDGALRWNVYAMAWSDQDPVPVSAQLAATRALRGITDIVGDPVLSYADGGWISLTPARQLTLDEAVIPTEENRVNYSTPPRHRSGLVADERMVLVGDPTNLASIQWTSNRPAESTNFTPSKGGGSKTLTSGNLNIPIDATLWQNPQSVDTITILCRDEDGMSVSYYMQPAAVTQGNSGLTAVMGFEQVTSTPGTSGPYAAQVVNNALFRPVDHGFIKSTANNYNLNHSVLSDDIANMWQGLRSKSAIVAEALDNRIFLLVHHADGDILEEGCRGNEVWVYDLQVEGGTWSRMLIQAHSLNVLTVGDRSYMGVLRPDGIYYLDWNYRLDDYVDAEGAVQTQPIDWFMETNTQGANRAHDAWAHLQQIVIMVGDFQGSMEYGIRGFTRNGREIEAVKRFTDNTAIYDETPTWDMEDFLSVRRDLKEWYFFARNAEGESATGQVSAVQYRYTPVSVNVGYQFGSVETFEYGRNVSAGPDVFSDNGIPIPNIDSGRP